MLLLIILKHNNELFETRLGNIKTRSVKILSTKLNLFKTDDYLIKNKYLLIN